MITSNKYIMLIILKLGFIKLNFLCNINIFLNELELKYRIFLFINYLVIFKDFLFKFVLKYKYMKNKLFIFFYYYNIFSS